MIVEKFDHTRIVSDTSFPILKCNQCLFFHQITDTDPPKFLRETETESREKIDDVMRGL